MSNMQWVVAIFNVFKNLPGAYLGDLKYYSGRKCKFRDTWVSAMRLGRGVSQIFNLDESYWDYSASYLKS